MPLPVSDLTLGRARSVPRRLLKTPPTPTAAPREAPRALVSRLERTDSLFSTTLDRLDSDPTTRRWA